MRNRVAYAIGILGIAAVRFWMSVRRTNGAGSAAAMPSPGNVDIDIDDDTAAELIARYRPALEAASSPRPE